MWGVKGADDPTGAPRGAGRRSRVQRAVLAWTAAALVLTAGGCGLGDRAELEDLITSAPRRAESGVVAGTVTVESRFIDGPDPGSGRIRLPAGAEDFELPEGGVAFGSDRVQFEM